MHSIFTKKSIILLLVIALTIGLIGCAGDSDVTPEPTTSEGNGEEVSTDTVSVENPADDYPNRPITIIVPFAAGGGTDLLARAISSNMDLGQPVAVQNLPGANTAIGTMSVYHAANDGHTLLVVSGEALVGYYIGGSLTIPAHEELEAIASMVYDANIVTVPKNSPFKSMDELIAYAKDNPGEVNWGSTGSKGSNEQASAEIWQQADIEVNYVPYDSASVARVAAMGGHVDVLLSQISEAKAMIESGDLVGIGVARDERSKFFPDVPTFKELGYNADNGQHRGIFAPPGTPQEIVDKLAAEMLRIYESPEFIDLCENQLGFEPQFDDVEAFKAINAERMIIQKELYDLITVD